ncbi:MAG: peptide chain release factor N(5)-glutamine methyltransferase [Planctomycetes bacterium]|nr:peptide chain release factor N(5)-glutamine methyltransferase [Planctomycetota bacterium]MCC7172899.1 peptide chain release factor N(5)-glutamine methyltransferase [Planctomycetota bacterium]
MTARSNRTLRRVLERAATSLARRGLTEARLDVEVLLGFVLGVSRASLVARDDEPIDAQSRAVFADLLRRRARRVPVAYLVGSKEFFGRAFRVDARVLVPRPETETLVEQALSWSRGRDGPLDVLDVGTGSGCIGITLVLEQPRLRCVAIDASDGAVDCARANASALGAGERFEAHAVALEAWSAAQSFDLIVSNPPYVEPGDRCDPETSHEPDLALRGASGPFPAIYDALLTCARNGLRPGGALMVEIGAGQAEVVTRRFEQSELFARVECAIDLAGIPRVVIGHAASAGHTEPTSTSFSRGACGRTLRGRRGFRPAGR